MPIFRPFPKNVSKMQAIDSGYIRIWYALNALDINKPKTYDDLQRLEIGGHISKYYSHFVFSSDSLCTEWGKENKGAQAAPTWMGEKGKNASWSEYYFSEYFKDFNKDAFTEYARMAMDIPNHQYSEEMPVQNWNMESDTLAICGYLCQKATCLFRGRNYTAWFTPDIPINNGPWKFGGLPGLILKVYDEEKECVFECVKIETCKKKYPIKIYDDYKNFKKTGRKEVLKLQKKIHENYFKVAGLVFLDSPSPPPQKYNPLELE
jgi:GLPGLI family protein